MTLQALIRNAGLKQREVADALGVHESTVSQWHGRWRSIPAQYTAVLANKLGVPVSDIVDISIRRDVSKGDLPRTKRQTTDAVQTESAT